MGGPPTKVVVSINILLAINHDDLDDLEKQVDGQLLVCSRDVQFEEDEFCAMVIGVMLEDQCSKHANSIQVNARDILMCNHCVQSKFTAGVVHHVSVPGFSTVCTGGLYIPRKSLVPNDGENLPALTSMSTCTAKNSHSTSILTV